MIIIENRVLPFKGFKAMTVWPFIFVRKGCELTETDMRHEEIHGKQQLEMLWLPFFVWYFVEWIVRSIQYKSWKIGYYEISLEWEALVNDSKKDYLKTRKHYAWTRRLKIPVKACVVVMGAMMLTGCKTPAPTIVERVKVDTTYITKEKRDSVYLHDSTTTIIKQSISILLTN